MSNISGLKRIHFIGIGGISMSALAKLAILKGVKVTGSDLSYNEEVVTLVQWGADVTIGHNVELLKDAELVVYTAAIPDNDPELVYANEAGISAVERKYFLSEVSKECEYVIAVSGTHGKTTTTAMLASAFLNSGLPFTAHIGGNIRGIGNLIYKGNRFFITEACEYQKSFLALRPRAAVILNAEMDHPDTYPGIDDVYSAFDEFTRTLPENGILIINRECEYYNMRKCEYVNTYSFGLEGRCGYVLKDVHKSHNGCYGFTIYENGIPKRNISLSIQGRHNIFNAAAAYITAVKCGISEDDAANAVESYSGVERRFECAGTLNGAKVINDYAHHPTELKASIRTAKEITRGKVIAIFQPHTFSRTAGLFSGFVEAFSDADEIYIFKEYAARENPVDGASAYDLYKAVNEVKDSVYYYDSMLSLASDLSDKVSCGDTVMVLGAGDVTTLSKLIAY